MARKGSLPPLAAELDTGREEAKPFAGELERMMRCSEVGVSWAP